jgi:hypothetical protein
MLVDSMENYSNLELNEKLSTLNLLMNNSTIESASNIPTLVKFCDNWAELMPLSLKLGAYVNPLAWERSQKKYRAKHMKMDEEGRMAQYGTKYWSDDDDPARALVMTLIKILESTKKST